MSDSLVPLVVLDPNRNVLDVLVTNIKGIAKSVEQGELWVLHGETGKLLPRPDFEGPVTVTRHGHFAVALVGSEAADQTSASADSPGKEESRDTAGSGNSSGGAAERACASADSGSASILRRLAEVIRRRKQELPEGSYTTHLFREGIDKIRKKLGEEAVELILAREENEMVHESADIIYHLLVLLEEAGVDYERVMEELVRRAE